MWTFLVFGRPFRQGRYGYILGGYTTSTEATVDCITFATQTTAALASATLTEARDNLAALSDGVRFGYTLGGSHTNNVATVVATAECTTFATQATAARVSANLSLARMYCNALSDGTCYGYTMGGYYGASQNSAVADCTTFATQATAALVSASLTLARRGMSCISDGSRYGYALGGLAQHQTDCITFATQVTASCDSAVLSSYRGYLAGMSGKGVGGYSLGGYTTTYVVTADKTTFATQVTAAVASANLTQARNTLACNSDGVCFGYAYGGSIPSAVATADCVTLATETTAALTSANLSQARLGVVGMADDNV